MSQLNAAVSVGAFVFARGGSKGLPGKNVRLLAGKPLIAYAIEIAFASKYVDRVIVSTDDEKIARVARGYGADVPFIRPNHLASDRSPEWLSWQHALGFLKDKGSMPEIFLSVPATAPLRDARDLDACICLLLEGGFDIVITVTEAVRNPYFNMIKMLPDGKAELAIKSATPISFRQESPQIFDVTTVAYAAKPSFILENNSLFDGVVGAVVVPAERALDIDTQLDFRIADFLMREKMENVVRDNR